MEQASLGSPANINLGGYVPAPVQRLSVAKQALLAFLSGAAGQVGNRLVEGAFTPDVSDVAVKDPTLVEAGMTPAKRNALQKFVSPMSQADLDHMQQIAGQKNYQNKSLGLEGKRVATEEGRAATEKQRAADTIAYEKAALAQSGGQFQQAQLADALRNNQNFILGQGNLARENKATTAQAGLLKSEQDKNNILTTETKARRLNDLLSSSVDPNATALHPLFRQAAGDAMNAGEIDPTTQTLDQMRGPVNARFQALVKTQAGNQPDQGLSNNTVFTDGSGFFTNKDGSWRGGPGPATLTNPSGQQMLY